MEWNYVWASIVVNFLIVFIVPRLIKKPTGVKILDDIVLFLNSQKSFILASSIVIGVVTYASHKWIESADGDSTGGESNIPEKF